MGSPTRYRTFNMPSPDTGGADGGKPVDLNVMKRNMSIANGFLDICLLSANANQLRNLINFGDKESSFFYLILTAIIISLVLQVSAGIVLILGERFDINKEEEQERGEWHNTLVVCLMFVVLIINVFVTSLGVDVTNPNFPTSQHHNPNTTTLPPTMPINVSKDHYG